MISRTILTALVVATAANTAAAQNATYAFTNVNVVPMTSETVLSDQTVVVHNGRITAVGPAARVNVPAGATRIDGRGKYLMPGLAEMHGHIPGQNVQFAERVA
ncbi:MAG TPA: hypothetical protein VGD49_04125, partial [Longimicrobiales bacterium]